MPKDRFFDDYPDVMQLEIDRDLEVYGHGREADELIRGWIGKRFCDYLNRSLDAAKPSYTEATKVGSFVVFERYPLLDDGVLHVSGGYQFHSQAKSIGPVNFQLFVHPSDPREMRMEWERWLMASYGSTEESRGAVREKLLKACRTYFARTKLPDR